MASQMEFMKIVHMGLNNRHLRPKTGGYFHATNATDVLTAPLHPQRHLSEPSGHNDMPQSVNVVHFEGDTVPVPGRSRRSKLPSDATPVDEMPLPPPPAPMAGTPSPPGPSPLLPPPAPSPLLPPPAPSPLLPPLPLPLPPLPPPPHSLSVEEIVLPDDSPTAELLSEQA